MSADTTLLDVPAFRDDGDPYQLKQLAGLEALQHLAEMTPSASAVVAPSPHEPPGGVPASAGRLRQEGLGGSLED